MKPLKIGLLREERVPTDRRVALMPSQCIGLMQQYNVQIVVQPSDVRCFDNKEYESLQIPLQENLSDCDILIGIKEVPIHLLIPNKTYLVFSHTIKKQAHNRKLLQTVIEKKIRLIDYEGLVEKSGERIIAFGRYAGIVGTYNGIWLYGKRYKLYNLKRAYECNSYEVLKKQLRKVKLPPIKIAVTGGGRVTNGVKELMTILKIKEVTPSDYLTKEFSEPVYTNLRSYDYNQHIENKNFDRIDFFKNPQNYQSTFLKYTRVTDLLIAAAYWNPQSPKLFTKEDIIDPSFNIKVIADITCDIEGSIPSTIRPSTIDSPAYDYNRITGLLEAPFSDENNITVMAVDNLPGEIPRMASEGFGIQLINNVLPDILSNNYSGVIKTGVVADMGLLTERYQYLKQYLMDE
jgi:saccharopine dehydrogenase (NAD+, L-lysine-forming)